VGEASGGVAADVAVVGACVFMYLYVKSMCRLQRVVVLYFFH